MQSIQKGIKEKLGSMEPNTLFFFSDFSELGKYDSIKKAVQRMEEKGYVIKVIDGLYCTPKFSRLTGELILPAINDIAYALARKFCWTIIPSGDSSLNILGLSTQVPSCYEYSSDGPYRKYEIYGITISFRHTAGRNISGLSYKSALIVQALKILGRDGVDESSVYKLRSILNKEEKAALSSECRNVPAWMYEVIREITKGDSSLF